MHREGAWAPGSDDDALRRLRPTDWGRVIREGIALATGTATAAWLGTFFSLQIPVGVAMFVASGLGLLSRRNDDRNLEDREQVFALREEFGLGPVWVVDLMVAQGLAPTGRDQGLIWIEGGRMMFAGLRTSFALVAEQAAGPVRHDAGLPGLRLRLNLELLRTTPAGPLSLSFWPVSDGSRRSGDDASDLRYALNAILDGSLRTKRPEMEGQWPPVAFGPGAPTLSELRRGALGRVVAWSAGAATIGLCFGQETPWFGWAVFLVVACGANLAIWAGNAPRWQAYHDARKLWGRP